MSINQDDKPVCLLDHCDKPQHGRGFCRKHLYHYNRKQPLVDYNKAEGAPESASGIPCRVLHEDIESRALYVKNHLSSVHQLMTRERITFKTLVMTCGNPDCIEYDHIDSDKSDYRRSP